MSDTITAAGAGLTGAVSAPPANAVRIAAGASIQASVDANPAGTAFLLSAGSYTGQSVRPKNGDAFYGAPGGGTVLDGDGAAHAFRGQGVSNVTISGLKITDYAPPKQGIGVLGTDRGSLDWLVENNEIFGIKVGAAVMLGTRMDVRNNHIHHNDWSGIGGYKVADAVIEHNEIAFNNQARQEPFTEQSDVSGVKVTQSIGTRVASNYVHDNLRTHGIWLDISNDKSVIEGNRVENNDGVGLKVELDYGAVVRNNLVAGNNEPFLAGFEGGGIYIQNSQDTEVYGNTFRGNGGGVWVYENQRGSGDQGPWITENVAVHDNTIGMSSGDNGLGGTAAGDRSIVFEDNDYSLSGTATLVDGRVVTVAQWQAAGHDTAASGATFSTGSAPPSGSAPTPTPTAQSITGTPNADQITGGAGNDTIRGGDGADSLNGAGGADWLQGGAGNDTVRGGDGADSLYGEGGADRLEGGAGADRFVYRAISDASKSAPDTIVDFRYAQGDRIDLSGIDASAWTSGDQAFSFIAGAFTGRAGQLHALSSSGGLLVEGDVNGDRAADFQVRVQGDSSLASVDFIL